MVWRHAFDLRAFGEQGKENSSSTCEMKRNPYKDPTLCHVHLRMLWNRSTGEEVLTLYHYTDDLAFRNVGNLEQTAAQLFASLKDERAHFGKGLYAAQHEPAAARLKCDGERSRVELWSC